MNLRGSWRLLARGLHLPAVFGCGLACALLAGALPAFGVPTPSMFSGVASIPIQSFVALVPAGCAVRVMTGMSPAQLATSRRPCLLAVVVAVVASYAVAGPILWTAQAAGLLPGLVDRWSSFALTSTGWLALAILVWRLTGPMAAAIAAPVALVLMGLAGRDAMQAKWWAWGLVTTPRGNWLLPVTLTALSLVWLSTIPSADIERGRVSAGPDS